MFTQAVAAAAILAGVARAQVTATGTMGVTNPTAASLGTSINQTSYSRLLSLNAIDDFCLFAPPTAGEEIGDSEAYEVAWCTQARNEARVIPDGTFSAVHFVKTPLYWQVQGFGDFTKINIKSGGNGGELDPHGATGDGNPVGGNVTCNATGSDVSYEEWMNYMAYDQFCLRICIAENSTYSAAIECQHTLDEMGCSWVMPGDYTNNSFTECDADSAYPPGVYPLANGSTSTFAQRYTGTYTVGNTSTGTFTVGYTSTPQTAYSTPASSNCKTYSTISNGITSLSGAAAATSGASAASTTGGSSAAATSGADSGSGSSGSSGSSSSSKTSSSGSSSSSSSSSGRVAVISSNFGAVFGAVSVAAGLGALLL